MGVNPKPPALQESYLDDTYLRGLEPETVGSTERRKVFEPNGMTLACRAGAAPIVAHRMIDGQKYPYTAAQMEPGIGKRQEEERFYVGSKTADNG